MKLFHWSQIFKTIMVFACLQTCCRNVDAVSQQVLSKTLYDHLMTDYDPSLLPQCESGSPVTLKMDIALRQIMDINEREQILTTNLWMRLNWNDCILTWDPTSYNNLTYIIVKYNDVWIPDINLYDSAADEYMLPGIKNYRAYISSAGSVTYNFPTIAKSICKVNVKYFPFDTQECPLQFGSWSHHGNELDMTYKNAKGDVDYYVANTEWTVQDFPVERHVIYYNCCPEPYPDVTFYIIMKRRPTFYILTILFPYVLTAFVSALGFVLPVESGEKVSLQVTVLLSLAVFLLIISESLPPSSDNFPLIGTYFASSMTCVSASLVQTVIVLNVFYRGTNGRTVPRWARVIFFRFIAKMLCVRTRTLQAVHPTGKMPDDSTSADEVTEHSDRNELVSIGQWDVKVTREGSELDYPIKTEKLVDNLVSSNKLGRRKEELNPTKRITELYRRRSVADIVNSEWHDLANVIDRMFFLIYVIATVVTTISFFLQCV